MAGISRRLETEDLADAIEIRLGWLFVDANGAVALDIRMAANGGNSGFGLSKIA